MVKLCAKNQNSVLKDAKTVLEITEQVFRGDCKLPLMALCTNFVL